MFSELDKVSQNQKSLAAFHGTVPAGCPDSRCLISSFLLGGTREEWPTNRSKQKTLTHGQKMINYYIEDNMTVPTKSENVCMFLKTQNLFAKTQCYQVWIRFNTPKLCYVCVKQKRLFLFPGKLIFRKSFKKLLFRILGL